MSSWLGSSNKKDVINELDALRSEITSIAKRVSGIAGATGDTLRDNVEQLRSNLPDSRAVSRAANSALDQGRHYIEQAGSEVRGGVREARVAVQQNPATSIAIAAGVGFLVGLMVGGGRSDD